MLAEKFGRIEKVTGARDPEDTGEREPMGEEGFEVTT